MKVLVALLVNGDWHLKPWEIRRLSLSQIWEIYFWPRDDKGKLEIDLPDDRQPLDPRTWFYRLWRNRRLRDDHIEKKWQEWVAADKARGA